MAVGSSTKEEIAISSGDEEEQAPPQLLKEAALTDEDFIYQVGLMTKRPLLDMGSSPPSRLA